MRFGLHSFASRGNDQIADGHRVAGRVGFPDCGGGRVLLGDGFSSSISALGAWD